MKILFGSPYHEPYDNGRLMADAIRRARPGVEVVHWDTRSQPEVPSSGRNADATIIVKALADHRLFSKLPGYRICIFPDALDRFPSMHGALRDYDRVLACNDPGAFTWAEWFPLGWSERLCAIQPRPEKSITSLFVGTNNSPARLDFVRSVKLAFAGGFQVYGNGWPPEMRAKPPVYFEDYVMTLCRANVVLNRHESPVGPNLKCFEIPQCAPMVVDQPRGIGRIFSQNLLKTCSYSDGYGALKLLHRYATDAGLAEQVRLAQVEAVAPYSYEKQMATVVEGLTR